MRVRDPGWKKFGSTIWDKHPGSATMVRSAFGPFRHFYVFSAYCIVHSKHFFIFRR
jgi:hypothetical protein